MPEWNAGSLLDLSSVYWRSCVLQAAVKLGLFDAIGDETLDSSLVAERTTTDPDACRRLLSVLTAYGMLEKAGNGYRNSPPARRWLCKDSGEYIGWIILHHHYLMDSWARLDQAVRTGGPVRQRSTAGEDTREAFLMGMFNTASLQAPSLVRQVDLSGRRRLLDLGGGPGTYAIHFCLHNPGLTAVVLDLPTTRPFAEKTIARFGLQDRIAFRAGDFLESSDLSGPYDVVWMSHILHAEGPQTCRELVRKAGKALEKDGVLLIHDFFLDDTGDGPFFPALFSLNMLTGTREGRSYRAGEVMAMMAEAGLTGIERLDYRGPSDSGIIGARKK
jgi:predicted O-methyltransferase YrrM